MGFGVVIRLALGCGRWKTKNSVPRVNTAHCSGERRELFFAKI